MIRVEDPANMAVWRRQQTVCKKCHQWRRSSYNPKSIDSRGHDPCIKDLPGEVWGCCGHGDTAHRSGYVAGTYLLTFRFFGNVSGNAIRRALHRVEAGFSLPMWAKFDAPGKWTRPTDRDRRIERRMKRMRVR
jgi:hypothetical protein